MLQRINHGGTNRIAVFSFVLFNLVYNLRRKTLWNPATTSNKTSWQIEQHNIQLE